MGGGYDFTAGRGSGGVWGGCGDVCPLNWIRTTTNITTLKHRKSHLNRFYTSLPTGESLLALRHTLILLTTQNRKTIVQVQTRLRNLRLDVGPLNHHPPSHTHRQHEYKAGKRTKSTKDKGQGRISN